MAEYDTPKWKQMTLSVYIVLSSNVKGHVENENQRFKNVCGKLHIDRTVHVLRLGDVVCRCASVAMTSEPSCNHILEWDL